MPKRLPKYPGAKRLRRHLHSRAAHSCGRSTAGARAHPVGKRTMVGCLRVREATRDTRAVPAGQCHPELCTNKATETRARKDGPDMRAGRKRGADRAIGSRRRQQRLVACRQRVQPVACHQAVQAVTPAAHRRNWQLFLCSSSTGKKILCAASFRGSRRGRGEGGGGWGSSLCAVRWARNAWRVAAMPSLCGPSARGHYAATSAKPFTVATATRNPWKAAAARPHAPGADDGRSLRTAGQRSTRPTQRVRCPATLLAARWHRPPA